ncbi:HEAT repeat domain-containing protein [Pseudoalteromonas sp. H105]|uniref:HEAT repeat domain-containing protein n=1 Tax=Pseudoalteromonas sp. H105 TaxID=1348393 RepID=UPI0007321890|nr:HEAT repeat domain-containing protein [Pseudoalteromonas sp. H105]KTF16068.1 hypothetical protein ATS75_06600 [Pseudoalteromonas sp. H105]
MISLHRLLLQTAPLLALFSINTFATCQPQFKFEVESSTHFNYSKLNQPAQRSDIKIEGKLSVSAVNKGAAKNWWSMPLPNYERPFAFKLDENGLISQFYFADETDSQLQDQLKGLAYYLQYQKTLSELESEHDTLGEYTAVYQQKVTADKPVLLFSKKNYQQKNTQKLAIFSHIDVLYSEHEITPSTCFLNDRQGNEKLRMVGQDLTFVSNQQFKINKLAHPFKTTLFTMPNDVLLWQSNQIPLTQAEKERLRKELLAFITQQDITQIDAHTLAILLKKYNAVIGALRDVILTKMITDKAQMRLFNALGQLDTAASQTLLSNLLQNTEKQPQIQFRALRALTQGTNVLSQQATDTLLSILNNGFLSQDSEVSSSFYMTLGILLNNRQNSEHSQQLSNAIVEHITLSENDDKKADLITALGNSRNEEHVALIDSYLNDSNPRIEKASIRALGMIQTQSAYSNLEQHFNRHSGRNTKAMVSALGNYQMQPKTSDAVLNLAVNNTDAQVRYASINALAKQQNNTGIKQTLRQALKNEKSKRNFTAIVEFLHAKPKNLPDKS